MARIRIGLSGWSYKEWGGDFYPAGMKPAEQLAFVAERFDTVEINRSFYSLLEPSVYRRWADTVPDGFLFAVKGSRFITHMKKLNDVQVPLGNFFASGVLELGDNLGPLLWQLPGRWRLDVERVQSFLQLLPDTLDDARDLAGFHDARVEAVSIPAGPSRPLRHVLEARDPTFFDPRLLELLEEGQTALAFSHSSVWPYAENLTTDFVYLRLHGPDQLYSSAYDDSQLESWAEKVQAWQAGGRDVFVYFDNDGGGHAPRDAQRLIELIFGT